MEDRAAALKLVPVSHETAERLGIYVALLIKWQTKTNLVAPSTLPHVWTRHVADSLQLLKFAPDARNWLDIGSGGGFPGIVLACALMERPGAQVHLVERNAKKAAFLREVLRATGSAGFVHCGDIADCVPDIPDAIDVVTARAVAPLEILMALAHPWLSQGAQALFLKGQDVENELAKITISGTLGLTKHRSLTGTGWIVDLRPRDPFPENLT